MKGLAWKRLREVLFAHALSPCRRNKLPYCFFFFCHLTFTAIPRKITVQEQARIGCGSCRPDEQCHGLRYLQGKKYTHRDFLKAISNINSATALILEALSMCSMLVLTCHGWFLLSLQLIFCLLVLISFSFPPMLQRGVSSL